jgi:hypothetical protein
MESEIVLKDITWKEGQGDKGPWRKLTLQDTAGVQYSTFANQIPKETMEVIEKLKAGDALKIEYEGTNWKGKTIFNLKGILDYAPAEDAPSNGGNRATHGEGDRASSIIAQAIIKAPAFATALEIKHRQEESAAAALGKEPVLYMSLVNVAKDFVSIYKAMKGEIEKC